MIEKNLEYEATLKPLQANIKQLQETLRVEQEQLKAYKAQESDILAVRCVAVVYTRFSLWLEIPTSSARVSCLTSSQTT